jgi:hypothetical protein
VLRKPEVTLWAAVIKGLDDCQQSDTPLSTLGEFVEKLTKSGWHSEDVRDIESCVLELLRFKKENELSQPAERSARRWRIQGDWHGSPQDRPAGQNRGKPYVFRQEGSEESRRPARRNL